MTAKLDEWLFNHAQVMGNTCVGIKDESGKNFAWQDSTTKEAVDLDGDTIDLREETLRKNIFDEKENKE